MDELSLAVLFSHPLGQIAVTVVVAALTSWLTVRMMTGERREAPTETSRPGTQPVARPVQLAAPEEGALIAAISAAVYAVIGAHRIVYVAPVRPGSSWTAEARTVHHTSHAPHAHASHH
jgi:hypothetical protein